MEGPAAEPRWAWLKEKSPTLHHFLTRDDKPYPVVREVLFGALLLLLVVAILWGSTGQPLNRSPVVVVESGSMMHCANGNPQFGVDCEGTRLGDIGVIDPGDLIFVKDIDGPDDVRTFAEDGGHHYGKAGDVIVFRPGGNAQATPIIHRAMVYLKINGDGTYDVAALGLYRIDDLTRPELQAVGIPSNYDDTLEQIGVTPADSGFVTRGDNNARSDQEQSGITALPVKPEWILGKARGEVPWLGLVKLLVSDILSNFFADQETHNYSKAASDAKLYLWLTLGVLIGGPYVYEKIKQTREGQEDA